MLVSLKTKKRLSSVEVLKIEKISTNCVHLAVSFQCKHWTEVHRGVRCQCPFLGTVFVCLKTCLQIHGLLVFCLYATHVSSVALPLTRPSKIQHCIRNLLSSTILLKKPPEMVRHSAWAAWMVTSSESTQVVIFHHNIIPLLCANINGKS